MRPTTQRADRPSIWSASAESEDVQILVGVRLGAWLLRKRRLIHALHRITFELQTLWEHCTDSVLRLASLLPHPPPLQWWTNYSHCLNGPWCKRLWAVVNVHIHWKFWFNEVCFITNPNFDNILTDFFSSLKLQTYASSWLQELQSWNLTDWRLVHCKYRRELYMSRYVTHSSNHSLLLMMSTSSTAFLASDIRCHWYGESYTNTKIKISEDDWLLSEVSS
jgi:hypothetical protein